MHSRGSHPILPPSPKEERVHALGLGRILINKEKSKRERKGNENYVSGESVHIIIMV